MTLTHIPPQSQPHNAHHAPTRPGYLTSQATHPTVRNGQINPHYPVAQEGRAGLAFCAKTTTAARGGGGEGVSKPDTESEKKKAQSPNHGKLQHRPVKSTAPVLSIPALIGRACFAIPNKLKPKPYAPRLLACLLAGSGGKRGSISTQIHVPVITPLHDQCQNQKKKNPVDNSPFSSPGNDEILYGSTDTGLYIPHAHDEMELGVFRRKNVTGVTSFLWSHRNAC